MGQVQIKENNNAPGTKLVTFRRDCAAPVIHVPYTRLVDVGADVDGRSGATADGHSHSEVFWLSAGLRDSKNVLMHRI
jgi:hypothetical protein